MTAARASTSTSHQTRLPPGIADYDVPFQAFPVSTGLDQAPQYAHIINGGLGTTNLGGEGYVGQGFQHGPRPAVSEDSQRPAEDREYDYDMANASSEDQDSHSGHQEEADGDSKASSKRSWLPFRRG